MSAELALRRDPLVRVRAAEHRFVRADDVRPREDEGALLRREGARDGLLDSALVPAAPQARRRARGLESEGGLPRRNARRAAASDLADGALGGGATGDCVARV